MFLPQHSNDGLGIQSDLVYSVYRTKPAFICCLHHMSHRAAHSMLNDLIIPKIFSDD